MNVVIITGLEIKPCSYARAVSRGVTKNLDVKAVEEQVAAFLETKGICLGSINIEACHPLPRKSATDRLAFIVWFVNRKHKLALLK